MNRKWYLKSSIATKCSKNYVEYINKKNEEKMMKEKKIKVKFWHHKTKKFGGNYRQIKKRKVLYIEVTLSRT